MRLLVACMFSVAACGGGGGGDRTDPIPAMPLAGMLNGTPWAAAGAKAKMSSTPGEKTIHIYPEAVTCSQILGPEPYVVLVTPWVAGNVEIDLESDSSIFIFMEATVHIVLDGRIEIPAAPVDVGATATVGVRARFEDSDDDLFVEGQIDVTVCE